MQNNFHVIKRIMKRVLLYLVAALLVLTVSSGKSSADPLSKGSVVVVDGKSYSLSNLTVKVGKIPGFGTSYTITNGDGGSVSVVIRLLSKSVGQIPLGGANFIKVKIGDQEYKTMSGTLTTTTFDDKHINGEFTGTLVLGEEYSKEYKFSGTFVSDFAGGN